MPSALKYYRRHTEKCSGSHTPKSLSNEYDERKRGWKRCHCPISAHGTLNRSFRRMVTGQSEWRAAESAMAPLIARGSWDEPTAAQASPEADTEPAQAITIEDASLAWFDTKKNRGLSTSSLKKYRTFQRQLLAFASDRGVVRLADLKTTDLDAFYQTWKDGKSSKGKKLERMKGFFNFCVGRDFLLKNPATPLEPPLNYAQHKQKTPFTDDELDRIFRAAAQWQDCGWHNGSVRGRITAAQVSTFAMLLTETGLRISDAATFNVLDRIDSDTRECFLFMHKTGKPLYTWINPDLYARLHALTVTHGPTPFITQSLDKERAADAWRERLAKVFTQAGPFAAHPTPHLFRHTFVRLQLQRGVSVDDVAELIGDTPEMVRRHYARWVPERQTRLTAIMKDAYQEALKKKWRGHVVPISGVKQG